MPRRKDGGPVGGARTERLPVATVEGSRYGGVREGVSGFPGQRGVQQQIVSAANRNRGPGPAFTPIRAVLDAASTPAYIIGNVAAGKPGEALQNLYTLGQRGDRTFLSQALRQRGLLPGGWAGAVLGLGTDILTDPTTYLTFGATAGARAATRAGSRALDAQLAAGTRIPIRAVVGAQGAVEAARIAAPKGVGVYLRLPFTRQRERHLFDVRRGRVGDAIARQALKPGETTVGRALREVFLPAGATNKSVHRIAMQARRYAESEKKLISQFATEFQDDFLKAIKPIQGLDEATAFAQLAKAIDNPTVHASALHPALAPLRQRAEQLMADWRKIEVSEGLDTAGHLQFYLPHLPATKKDAESYALRYPKDPNTPFFERHRNPALPDLDAWEAVGLKPETNVARLLEIRGHASVDARMTKAVDDVVAAQWGRTGAMTKAQNDWVDFPSKFQKGTKISPEIAKAINRVHAQITPAVSSIPAIQDAVHFINTIGSSWKALALLSPGYHMRNMQSDLLSAYWAGARNPLSFVQAGRLMTGGLRQLKLGNRVYTREELINLAEAVGSINMGHVAKDVRADLARTSSGVKDRSRRVARPGKGRISEFNMKVGENRENMVRLGLLIELMKRGDDPMRAGQITRDFLFDYGDVGRFVAAARRFWLPFITFSSKALPMFGRMAVQRPGTLANFNKVTETLNREGGDPDRSLLPLGARSSFAVPGLTKIVGGGESDVAMFNPESVLAIGALNQFDPTHVVRSGFGFLNPIPKGLVEAGTDYSFFFNRSQPSLVRAPAVINALAKMGVPIPGYDPQGKRVYYPAGKPNVPGYSRNLDIALRMLPVYSQAASLIPGGGAETTRQPYLRWLLGLSVSPYDQQKARFYAEKFRDR